MKKVGNWLPMLLEQNSKPLKPYPRGTNRCKQAGKQQAVEAKQKPRGVAEGRKLVPNRYFTIIEPQNPSLSKLYSDFETRKSSEMFCRTIWGGGEGTGYKFLLLPFLLGYLASKVFYRRNFPPTFSYVKKGKPNWRKKKLDTFLATSDLSNCGHFD